MKIFNFVQVFRYGCCVIWLSAGRQVGTITERDEQIWESWHEGAKVFFLSESDMNSGCSILEKHVLIQW